MYCGDETGSFIGDVGSHVCRFGYGGEDSPKFVTSPYQATSGEKRTLLSSPNQATWADSDSSQAIQTPLRMVHGGDDPVISQQPITDPAAYLQQGDSIGSLDALETTWQNALESMHVLRYFKHTSGGGQADTTTTTSSGVESTTLRPVLAESKCVHPLLAVVPGCTYTVGVGAMNNDAQLRKDMIAYTELLFEKFDARAVFLAPTPMVAAFSHGRQTACVVDVGASGCRVTPVVDGLLLKNAQRRNGRGGDWLGNVQWKALLSDSVTVEPRYRIRQKEGGTPTTTAGSGLYHRWAMQDVMYEFRTSGHVELPPWWYDPSVPFLYDNPNSSQTAAPAQAATDEAPYTYQLPDGTTVDLNTRIGKDLCRVPELLFSEQLPFDGNNGGNSSIVSQHATLSSVGLHKLVHASLEAVGDVDARRELAGSILLTGGSAVLPNLEKRLALEMNRMSSPAFKTKVLASKHMIERSCASWIGASVLTSLGSFQQLWLSKAEYDEYGAALAIQRFP